MNDTRLIVTKTLIIGLGTTGTRICEQLANRISWEYGDLKRVPWVRFLCLETDSGGAPKSQGFDATDFIPLSISSNEYADIAQFTPVYDEAIYLSRWADRETLDKIPHKSVDVGVGNIRMIGRLAFFHQRNYNHVRNAVNSRLGDLRRLQEPDAADSLGELPDGSRPTVAFAAQTQVRIFVVGTLCGGTCSGLAGDFGFFLQSLTIPDEKIIGIFTLPHPELSITSVPSANRYKKNAYTALVELNHYHRKMADEIPFPGHFMQTKGIDPYDLPYLAMPHQNNQTAINALEMAIKDRIFLNVFVPETDPFAGAVDGGLLDRDGHAHVFCAFGISTIEFPAQQVMDACTKRLLLKAVREWNSRVLPEGQEHTRLGDMGLTYDRIKERLLRVSDGTPLQTRLNDQVELVIQAARKNDEALRQELTTLRAALSEAGALGSPTLPPGLLPQTVQANITASAQQVYYEFRAAAANRILSYDEGPGRLAGVYKAAKETLTQMRQIKPRDVQGQERDVDRAVQTVSASRHKKNFLSKELVVDETQVEALRRTIQAEIAAKIERECQRALISTSQEGRPRRGVAELLERLIEPGVQRVHNFRNRLTSFQQSLDRDVETHTRTAPDVNGVALFNGETKGTVRQEYEQCLMRDKNELNTSFEEEESRAAGDVIAAWTGLIPALLPDGGPNSSEEWLRETYLVGSASPLRPQDEAQLSIRARAPFTVLRGASVLDRWQDWPNGASEAQRACKTLEPFLSINDQYAQRGGRAPLSKRRLALLPEEGNRKSLASIIEAQTGIDKFQRSPDPYRVVLIEEIYRFPLYAARDIVGNPSSLFHAVATDFPTFHTRKDVYWTGLSDEDAARAVRLEQLVVIGLLLGILEGRDGVMCMEWTPGGVGQDRLKRLPLSIKGAARALAFERAEIGGTVQQLKNASNVLEDRIAHRRQNIASDVAFVEFLGKAFESGDYNYVPDWREDGFAGQLVNKFCASDPGLYTAWCLLYPPDPSRIASMRQLKGNSRPTGGFFAEDGLYCTDDNCCGFVGKDERDAAAHGWRCFLNPAHDYSVV